MKLKPIDKEKLQFLPRGFPETQLGGRYPPGKLVRDGSRNKIKKTRAYGSGKSMLSVGIKQIRPSRPVSATLSPVESPFLSFFSASHVRRQGLLLAS